MYDVILFGGTTEGRQLAQFLSERKTPALVCVATEYGEKLLDCRPPVQVQSGRRDRQEIAALLWDVCPRLVIDATHPYATQVSENLQHVCADQNLHYVRVLRERIESGGCVEFDCLDTLVSWLNQTEGVIFAAIGAKEARALTKVPDFARRVYLRMLPSPEGIAACIDMGYPRQHLICMQGPFSEELNIAMFREVGAKILVTKESGANGGFSEKLSAARACGMQAAILARPPDQNGMALSEVKSMILEVCG